MNERMNPDIQLRIMQESDFPDCERLREQAGWNQTLIDWRRFLSFNPSGNFVATLNGQVVGIIFTIPYEDRFGWVAAVIVDQNHRRVGIGGLLMNAGIEHLENRGVTVKLDATPAGKMLYDTLGFFDEYGLARMVYEASGGVLNLPLCEPIAQKERERIIAYDAPIFGANRSAVLQSYLQYYPQFGFYAAEGTRISGYIMAREGINAFHIGPWIADDPDTAKQLLASVLQTRQPGKAFIDIVDPNPHVCSILESLGFREQRTFMRMYKGNNSHPGLPEKIYGISGPELG